MSFQALLYSGMTIGKKGKKDTRMWRPRGFRASLLTTSRLQHAGKKRRIIESGGEEKKVRGAIKKKSSWKRGYISRNPMLDKE